MIKTPLVAILALAGTLSVTVCEAETKLSGSDEPNLVRIVHHDYDVIAERIHRHLDTVATIGQVETLKLGAIKNSDAVFAGKLTEQVHLLDQELFENIAVIQDMSEEYGVKRVCELSRESKAVHQACNRKSKMLKTLSVAENTYSDAKRERKEALEHTEAMLNELMAADSSALEVQLQITQLLVEKERIRKQLAAEKTVMTVFKGVQYDDYGDVQARTASFGRGTRASVRSIKGRISLL